MTWFTQFLQAVRPILEPALAFGMLIIIVLLRHQQKMAAIVRQDGRGAGQNAEVESLRREMELLKATVNQQTILLDHISSQQRELTASLRNPPAVPTVEQRLGGG